MKKLLCVYSDCPNKEISLDQVCCTDGGTIDNPDQIESPQCEDCCKRLGKHRMKVNRVYTSGEFN